MVNLGFASDLNTSAYKVPLIKASGQILTSNQLEFEENSCKEHMGFKQRCVFELVPLQRV